MHPRLSVFALLLWSALVTGCGARDQTPALFVEILQGEPMSVDQLRVAVAMRDGQTLGPLVRPEAAGAPLSGAQSLRLLLPAAPSETALSGTLRIDGLQRGAVVASGEQTFVAPAESETEVTVVLLLSDPCRQVTCADGQRCEKGACLCDEKSCTGGCCAGTSCRALSVDACGPLGGACMACDAARADRCTPAGCQCGSGPSCGQGQRCEAGMCRCDAESCAGCCSLAGSCLDGTEQQDCGHGGGTCKACKGEEACNKGKCER